MGSFAGFAHVRTIALTKKRAGDRDVSRAPALLSRSGTMAKMKRRTGHETVRASIVIDVALYARWGAAAALRRIDRSAFAVEALAEACRGVLVIDRRKPAGQVKLSDRLELPDPVSSDGPDDAA